MSGSAVGALFMLLMMAIAVLAILALFPETATALTLRRLLVEEPARILSRITRGRIALFVIVGLIGAGLFVLFETEGVRLFAFMLPETVGWFAAFDVSLFVDAAIVALAAAGATRIAPLRQKVADLGKAFATSLTTRMRRAARAVRTRAARVVARRPNDDPDRTRSAQPAFGYQAAFG